VASGKTNDIMVHHQRAMWMGALCMCALLLGTTRLQAAPESQRLDRAKDLISDEQWVTAIQELKAAADDPKEPARDEALFWLAHCESQARDTAAAVGTIQRLERGYPRSRWVRPARSLRIEIAQRLRRNDVLWYTAAAPPPPPEPPEPPPAVARHPGAPPPVPAPATARAGVPPLPPPTPTAPWPPLPPPPPPEWMFEGAFPDTDLRIQALGSLMRTDALRVIPMLKDIALTGSSNPGEARRALFLLAQSSRADARATVVEVAKTGPEPVRLAAVRELGRLDGPAVPGQLMQVYETANSPVKYQIVMSLGQRDAVPALMRIAQSETDRDLRAVAIATLGEAGGREQLSTLYARLVGDSAEVKWPIILGLFNAQADEELIRIAERERDPKARAEILAKLRLLGTARAKAYLASHK
jgi:HEAT repeats